MISDRVFSYRINTKRRRRRAWAFKSGHAWRRFMDQAVSVLQEGTLSHMCRTDIARYYPSVRLDVLEELLRNYGCDSTAVSRIVRTLAFWQRNCGLSGLPIGPEASAVLGNIFLEPVDRAIVATQALHFRYGDDILFFCRNARECDAVVSVLDQQLNVLRLLRSLPKTRTFDDPGEAIDDLRDGLIGYLESFLDQEADLGAAAVRRSFDAEIQNQSQVSRSRFRWITRTLKNLKDPYACLPLAREPRLMNLDPRLATDYLASARLDRLVVDACMVRLTGTHEEWYEGLDLHLLRALVEAKLGAVEGEAFFRIASDGSRLWPVRSWAWHAYAASPARRDSRLMEAAREEPEPRIRRAIVSTLKSSYRGRRHREFIRHVKRYFPESRFTAHWLEAA